MSSANAFRYVPFCFEPDLPHLDPRIALQGLRREKSSGLFWRERVHPDNLEDRRTIGIL
jgi:hypothetical protein